MTQVCNSADFRNDLPLSEDQWQQLVGNVDTVNVFVSDLVQFELFREGVYFLYRSILHDMDDEEIVRDGPFPLDYTTAAELLTDYSI
jgi:hypothetical protein